MKDDQTALAHLGTVMPSGAPQVTPVWFDYDGRFLRVNSAKGRVKDKNMRRNPRRRPVHRGPGEPLSLPVRPGPRLRGHRAGGDAHIDRLARKYLGQDRYPYRGAGEIRVIPKIAPDRVGGMG